MSYFNDAKSLVEHASKELPKLERAYEESLHQEEVQSALKIEIKNIMENLRSALDFAARGLFDKYGFSNRSDQKIYFPYALLSQTKTEFHSKNGSRNLFLVLNCAMILSPSSIHINTIRNQAIDGCLCLWNLTMKISTSG